MESTFEEYKEWVDGKIDSDVQHQYKKALAQLKERKPFEDALVSYLLTNISGIVMPTNHNQLFLSDLLCKVLH